MNALTIIHLASSAAMTLCMIIASLLLIQSIISTPSSRDYSLITVRIAAMLAVLSAGTGLWTYRVFESTRRRAVYFESFSAGQSLDRVSHWGLTAIAFTLACAFVPEKSQRKVTAIAAAVFGTLAFIADAMVHARLPSALVP